MNFKNLLSFTALACIFLSAGCDHDDDDPYVSLADKIERSGYPEGIGTLIVTRCATSGCHDAVSKDAAAGLDLSTWEDLFKGGNGGAVVLPYRPDHSTLMYYINHDSILGIPQLQPTMPVNNTPLSENELEILYMWILNGAPDKTGFIKFSDNPLRKKYYVANQGCDLVTVFDASSNLAMRAVNVGSSPLIESPHMVRVAPDNLSYFVCFIAGGMFEQYSTIDNTRIGQVSIGVAQWNTFVLSPDGTKAYVVDFSNGKLAVVDINTMTANIIPGWGNPHGSAISADGSTLYMTAQLGSYLFKIPVNDPVDYEIIDLRQHIPSPAAELEPHELTFTPDHSKYFVTCGESNEVRVYQTSNDSLLAAIPVDLLPQELDVSEDQPYLFVTCMDAINANPQQRGSVAIINYNTNQLVKSIYPGYQPHGIAVDDANDRVYVANRNASTTGPPPHHGSLCGGRNGYVTVIDLNTLELIPGSSTEVSVDPYSIDITH